MLKSMFHTSAVMLVLAAMFATIIYAVPTEFTAQVYLKKNGKTVENLTVQDFQLLENQREQTITKVERETQPLSIVFIPMLGEGQYCDTTFLIFPKPAPSNDMSVLAKAFNKYLNEDDEYALILPDEEATVLRGFEELSSSPPEDFAVFRKISDERQVTITEESTDYNSMGMNNTTTKSYYGVHINFADNALDKSLAYLQTQSKEGNRQVIFFLRPFYNLSQPTPEKEMQLKQTIARQGILFNWIGDDKEVYPFAPYKFFRNLPEVTGSEKQPCKLLKSNDEKKIGAIVSGMLEHLRTRYRIIYSSNNSTSLGNLRQTELRLTKQGNRKARGQTVISAPQIVNVE